MGHLAPGFALANRLESYGVRSLFATPGEAREATWFEGRGQPARVAAPRLPRSPVQSITFGPVMAQGVFDALRLMRRERVDAVVALGGWPCVPAAIAARIARRPLAFVVADAVPGLVVAKLLGLAGRVYVATETARAALGGGDRVRLTGPLVRPELLEGRRDPAAFGLDPEKRTLLVLGGSLGARGLFERWRLGLQYALVADPGLAPQMQVLHSIGDSDVGVGAIYARHRVAHRVVPFVHDMATAYATADLVLARAGAGTCAELAATATPAVLVPYPHHADRQQFENAKPLVAAGGAILIEEEALDPKAVERDVIGRLLDPGALAGMRAALAGGQSGGVDQTAADLVRFIGLDAAPAS